LVAVVLVAQQNLLLEQMVLIRCFQVLHLLVVAAVVQV
jgi:hypothetical protein